MSIEAQSELRRWADMWGKWVGPEGDRERYKRMAQYAIDGAEAIAFRDADAREVEEHSAYADKVAAERDTLRAELAAALEACGDNAKAWQDCVEESAIKRTHLMAEIGLTEQQRNAASARAEKAEAEATALKAHVERLRGAISGILPGLAPAVWYADEEGLTDPIMTEVSATVGVLRELQRAHAATPAQSAKGDPDEKHV